MHFSMNFVRYRHESAAKMAMKLWNDSLGLKRANEHRGPQTGADKKVQYKRNGIDRSITDSATPLINPQVNGVGKPNQNGQMSSDEEWETGCEVRQVKLKSENEKVNQMDRQSSNGNYMMKITEGRQGERNNYDRKESTGTRQKQDKSRGGRGGGKRLGDSATGTTSHNCNSNLSSPDDHMNNQPQGMRQGRKEKKSYKASTGMK